MEAARLALGFTLGVKGLGGVFSILARTASRELSGGFAMVFMPAFHNHKPEAIIIGRLLAGYGELEFGMCLACGHIGGGLDKSIKTLFHKRDATARITRAYGIGHLASNKGAYRKLYERAFAAMRHCLLIRNQYAHAIWMYGYNGGLRFSDLEEIARDPHKASNTADLTQYVVTEALLQEQEAYFLYAHELWTYLNYEAQKRAGILPSHSVSIPSVIPKPRLHILAPDKFHLVRD